MQFTATAEDGHDPNAEQCTTILEKTKPVPARRDEAGQAGSIAPHLTGEYGAAMV